ncbi:MAG: ABC transporter ATP-binding protein [Christensenellaceae bacterium]|jgi:putative ABC transport system ATP-binding protein|nr:ABC transporter ATP-binding protein [Christensenellaceae bacterium]
MSKPLLRLVGISKSYSGRKILDGINFEVYPGDFVSISGISGVGKSTLLNIMALFEKQDAGEYYINDEPIPTKEIDVCRIRNNNFGFIFQAYNLLSGLTTCQNIVVPLQYADKEHQEAGLGRIKELIVRLGLEHIENEKVDNLSGGEKQRVAIARALINNPRIIFADEPTGNLDISSRDKVLSILKDLNSLTGVAIVIVTHDIEVASCAWRKLKIFDSKLCEG